MIESQAPLAIVLPPWLAAVVVPIVALHRPALARALVLASALVSLAGALVALGACVDGGTLTYEFGRWAAPFGIVFRLDGLSAVMATLVAGIGVAVLVYAGPSAATELPGRESGFLATAALLLAALQGIALTGDLFNLYVFIEISSIAGYTLIATGGGIAAYASFRYLLLGTLGAGFYLLGVALLFAMTGTLNMADMAARLPEVGASPATLIALAFLVAGLGLKMAVFPMHGWLADAYTYAPSAATALIAALMTKLAAYALLRVTYGVVWPAVGPLALPITSLLGWLAVAGIVAGSVMAIAQRDLKRLLAYSSVGHLGYITLGIALGNANGLIGAMLHIVGHGVTKSCLFLVAGAASRANGDRGEASLDLLGRRMPASSFAFVVASLSMIGIPPTVGFFSKWYLLLGCLDDDRWTFAAVLLVSTWLNAWYFFRLIERVYFASPGDGGHGEGPEVAEAPAAMLGPILALAFVIVAAGLGSYPLVRDVLRPAVDALPVAVCAPGEPCGARTAVVPRPKERS